MISAGPLVFAFVAVSVSSAATDFNAGDFNIGGLVGKAVRFQGTEVETEWEYWQSPDPVMASVDVDFRVQFLPWDEVVDGVQVNAMAIFDGEMPGPPTYGGTPVILSDTQGFMQFGNHPNRPCSADQREHFIGGIVEVPGAFKLGEASTPAHSVWEGCWDNDETWEGTVIRTLSVNGLETIEHPALGMVEAYRVDVHDERTKVSHTEPLNRSTEVWDTSLWLVEGHGVARWDQNEVKVNYRSWFKNGKSPAYRAETSTVWNWTITCIPDLTFDSEIGSGDLAALIAAWGASGADLDVDGTTDTFDLAILLAAWGPCP